MTGNVPPAVALTVPSSRQSTVQAHLLRAMESPVTVLSPRPDERRPRGREGMGA